MLQGCSSLPSVKAGAGRSARISLGSLIKRLQAHLQCCRPVFISQQQACSLVAFLQLLGPDPGALAAAQEAGVLALGRPQPALLLYYLELSISLCRLTGCEGGLGHSIQL